MVATIIHGSEGGNVISRRKWTSLRPFRKDGLSKPFQPWFDHPDGEEAACDDPVDIIPSECHKAKISKYTGREILSDSEEQLHVDRLC